MTDPVNPWIAAATGDDAEDPTPVAPVAPRTPRWGRRPPSVSGPIGNLAPPPAERRFPYRAAAAASETWFISAHGGAGSSTLASVLGHPSATRTWPVRDDGQPVPVVLVCRSNVAGLEAGRDAARDWASDAADSIHGVDVVGLVVVADAPGRLPKELQHNIDLLTGAVPRLWRIPWEDRLRTSTATADLARSTAWRRLADAVTTITTDQEQS